MDYPKPFGPFHVNNEEMYDHPNIAYTSLACCDTVQLELRMMAGRDNVALFIGSMQYKIPASSSMSDLSLCTFSDFKEVFLKSAEFFDLHPDSADTLNLESCISRIHPPSFGPEHASDNPLSFRAPSPTLHHHVRT